MSEVIPVGLDPREITIQIASDPRPDSDPATDEVWERMRRDTPRLFDGDILAFEGWDSDARTIHARRDGFKRLTVQPEVETGVTILSVTGLLRTGEGSDERVLLARRSSETRVYPQLWEFAPSGGIDAPRDGVRVLTGLDAWNQLKAELLEELGVTLARQPAPVCALTIDRVSNSCDLVFDVRFDERIEIKPASWEYVAASWFTRAEIPARHELIPPTAALLDVL